MDVRRACELFVLVVLALMIMEMERGEAGRVLLEDFSCSNPLETYPSMYSKARSFMDCWVGRLAAGPSPKGPGH